MWEGKLQAKRTKDILTLIFCVSTTFNSFSSVSNTEPTTKVKEIILVDLLA